MFFYTILQDPSLGSLRDIGDSWAIQQKLLEMQLEMDSSHAKHIQPTVCVVDTGVMTLVQSYGLMGQTYRRKRRLWRWLLPGGTPSERFVERVVGCWSELCQTAPCLSEPVSRCFAHLHKRFVPACR